MGCKQSSGHVVTSGQNTGFEMPSRAEVDSRIECIKESCTHVLGSAKVRYAYLSQRGYYPDDPNKPNQDALSITHNFCNVEKDAFLAVYDGHGRYGDKCAQYCKNRLPELIAKHVTHAKMKQAAKASAVNKTTGAADEENNNRNDSLTTRDLSKDQIHEACRRAHIQCNQALRRSAVIDDSLSGTTAISAFFHGARNRMTICNVGDSRAVMGQRRKSDDDPNSPSPLKAMPLSRDQTPYRKDERVRVKKCGARILTLDQIEGLEPEAEGEWNNDTEIDLGEEIDEWGDPPRIWDPRGEYPGTAFTRSIGDSYAEELGVYAEPEMITRELSDDDKIIVLASDGVFEFLTNQSVIDICAKFHDPLEACRAVVAEAYELWLQYELRTDDITIICIFVDGREENNEPLANPGDLENNDDGHVQANGDAHTDDPIPLADVSENKPVRLGSSKEARAQIESKKNLSASFHQDDMSEFDDDLDIASLITEKTEEEEKLIADAIKASVMFRNLSKEQQQLIYGVMEPVKVAKGEWVIKQGSTGDKYYVVDDGTFEVRIVPDDQDPNTRKDGGDVVHVYVGSRATNAHPSFGELALMHSAPRAASVIALSDGNLWALHRSAFRKVLRLKTNRLGLMAAMRKLESLKCLTNDEIENLCNKVEERSYKPGQNVVEDGKDDCNGFYFVTAGECEYTSMSSAESVDGGGSTVGTPRFLNENMHFGGRWLFGSDPPTVNVTAVLDTKCFVLTKAIVEENVKNFYDRRERYESQISGTT